MIVSYPERLLGSKLRTFGTIVHAFNCLAISPVPALFFFAPVSRSPVVQVWPLLCYVGEDALEFSSHCFHLSAGISRLSYYVVYSTYQMGNKNTSGALACLGEGVLIWEVWTFSTVTKDIEGCFSFWAHPGREIAVLSCVSQMIFGECILVRQFAYLCNGLIPVLRFSSLE